MTGYESKKAMAKDKLAQPAQEPVAWLTRESVDGCWYATAYKVSNDDKPLYTTPPQRPWVGLTDAEAQWLYDNCRTPSNLIDMVETMLKDKNT